MTHRARGAHAPVSHAAQGLLLNTLHMLLLLLPQRCVWQLTCCSAPPWCSIVTGLPGADNVALASPTSHACLLDEKLLVASSCASGGAPLACLLTRMPAAFPWRPRKSAGVLTVGGPASLLQAPGDATRQRTSPVT